MSCPPKRASSGKRRSFCPWIPAPAGMTSIVCDSTRQVEFAPDSKSVSSSRKQGTQRPQIRKDDFGAAQIFYRFAHWVPAFA
jgi:hypothetical protein